MDNITYFIGAGASYHSLPLIKTMNTRMMAFSTFLKTQKEVGRITHEFTEQFITDLDQLIEIESERTSIDAYAKELFINGALGTKIKLLRLKAILSSYLIFEQLIKPSDLTLFSQNFDYSVAPPFRLQLDTDLQKQIKTSIDKRYITFWAEYLSETRTALPDNIKILSWNYDMQFEASYSQVKNYSLELAQQNLQIFPSPQTKIEVSRSCILKLNGTAGLFDDYYTKKPFNHFDLREHKLMDNLNFLIDPLARNYHRAFSKPLISFAWETEGVVNETRQLAKLVIEQTNILVIIGYSFPSFNRLIDKDIFANISNLKKVYYQAPQEELDELLEKLDGININLRPITKPITNLATFHIPI